ncbi:MAG: hypothetical protein LC798_15430 [Chloroflexi bacterium]|nr:hypothetical protein [Chloroflexota bacterium]
MPRPTPEEISAAYAEVAVVIAQWDVRRRGALEVLHEATKLLDLMGASEVAEALGTTTSNVNPRGFSSLPEPLYRLRGGKLYDAEAIRALARERETAKAKGADDGR